MPKRRADADGRRFFDEFVSVRAPARDGRMVRPIRRKPRLIPFPGGKQKLLNVAHTRLKCGGGWSFFVCPGCAKLAQNLWSIDDRPLCAKCCNGLNIWHRTKWGFGCRERLRARDQKLDELIAKVDATTPLRFNPAPKHWRGKALLVSNSRGLTARMRRSLIFCRLAMLASQQAAKQGEMASRAYQPRTEAARATDITPIWRARPRSSLSASIRPAQTAVFAALDSHDPQQRLNAAKLMLRTRQARERGW